MDPNTIQKGISGGQWQDMQENCWEITEHMPKLISLTQRKVIWMHHFQNTYFGRIPNPQHAKKL